MIGYDLENNPISQTISGQGKSISTVTVFDKKFTKMTSFTDGNYNTTTYDVNETNGNIDQINLPTGRKIIFHYYPNGDLKDTTDQYGTLTRFSNYNEYGNPQTIVKDLGGGEIQEITQTFDARSRQRSSRDSLGVEVTIDYDNLDRPTRQITIDPAGFRDALTTTTSYLPEGQPQRQTRSGEGQTYSAINEYDNLQRVKKTTETVSGYGNIVRNYTYDKNSNLKTEQNRRGITTERTYNDLNHLTKIVQGGKTIWDASGFGDVDKVGNPKEVIDLYGKTTNYVYDGLERLVQKKLPETVTETLEYDDNNNISASYDRNNNKTEYKYDPLNRVAQVKDALGKITKWTYTDAAHTIKKESVTKRLTETTVMDGLERPVLQQVIFGGSNYETVYEYSGRKVSVTDPRGTVIKHELSGYGENGTTEVVGAAPAYKTAMHYAAFGGVKQMTDALNRVTTITNDGFNRQRAIDYNGTFSETRNYDGEGLMTAQTDRRGVTSSQSYDDLGRKTITQITKTAPETGNITFGIDYNDADSQETVTDANAHSTVYDYDGLRRVKQITNADGKIKKLIYDGENLREEGDFFNTDERRTKYVYDKLNRVREITDRKGKYSAIVYSDDDLVKTTTDRRGNVTTEIYDQLGRLTSAESYGKLAGFTYDGNNNRLTQQDGLDNETTFTYDKLNRLTTVTHPNDLQTETYTYDAEGNLKTHNDGRTMIVKDGKYDALDHLTEMTDGENNVTKFAYDGGGLLLSKTEPKGDDYKTIYAYNALGSLTAVTDADAKTWKFEYDNAQNLRFAKDALFAADGSRVTEYQYDALNRLKKTIQPQSRVTTYNYDNDSNLISTTDPKGQTAAMNYDELDRLDDATYKDADNIQRLFHDYKYDAEDNLYEVAENRGGNSRIYKREYDTRNRLTKTIDGANKSVAVTYDAANNLKTLTDASSRVTTYNYDQKNQLDTVKQGTATIADYDWYADGLQQKVTYQNTTSRNYAYDNANRVTKITNSFANSGSESFDYGYDANSNRQSEVRKTNGQAFRTIAYTYDKVDRLTDADYTTNVQTPPNPPVNQMATVVENTNLNKYGYDAVGNRTSEKKKTKSKTITLTTDGSGGNDENRANFDLARNDDDGDVRQPQSTDRTERGKRSQPFRLRRERQSERDRQRSECRQ